MTLSKANPEKNLQIANDQNEPVFADAMVAIKAAMLQYTTAGILPLWSATHPKRNPPMIEPQKNIA